MAHHPRYRRRRTPPRPDPMKTLIDHGLGVLAALIEIGKLDAILEANNILHATGYRTRDGKRHPFLPANIAIVPAKPNFHHKPR